MRKIMTLVGTRPELIKMSRVIAELDSHRGQIDHVLVHSGQNHDYELNQVFFDELEIRKPDRFLGVSGETPALAIADIIAKADEAFAAVAPDALLLYGDTNTCLAVIAAKRRKIPVFHMEAGNRCFDQRVPEELNRKVVDHLSDINMVVSEHARRYLVAEGLRPETIIKTGSHMPEVLAHYMPKIEASDVLKREKLDEARFFVVSAHREENVDEPGNLRRLIDTLQALEDEFKLPIIVSTHPRTRKRLEALGASLKEEALASASLKNEALGSASLPKMVRLMKPFGLLDYLKLQRSAFCVLSDSGTLTEEASLLNLAAVTIRNTHERPEGMDVGTLVMSGLTRDRVLEAVNVVTRQHDRTRRVFPVVPDYETGPVSKQVTRIVLSYIDYVNRTVWGKA